MSLPELLAGAVDDEDVVARVPLGGDDVLVVTPTRTLVYRAEGLLSDETVEEYGHDVERIDVSTGRRKAKLTLSYGLDGDETITLPSKRLEDALHPVLAGILSGAGVTAPGESVVRTFRFSELTLVVTSHRLVKHIGGAVWDGDFEEFPYADLVGLDFEEGTVATSVVLAHDGRSERFKAPNESARAVRETLVDAVCAFHEVDSLEEFRLVVAEDPEEDEETAGAAGATDFGNGPDPLSASPVSDAEAAAASGTEPAVSADPLAESGTAGSTDGAAGSTDETAESTDETAESTDGPDGTIDEMSVAETSAGETASVDPLAGDPGTNPTSAVGGDETPPPGTNGAVEGDRATERGDGSSVQPAPNADAVVKDTVDKDAVAEDAVAEDAVAKDTVAEGAVTGEDVAEEDEPEGGSAVDAFEGSAFESPGIADETDLAAEVAALRETVAAQSEQVERQSELIERLIAELRQGR